MSGGRDSDAPPEDAPPEDALVAAAESGGDEAEALSRFHEGDRFEFRLSGGRGFILDFVKGRDVISLEGLGLTPWDLLPSIRGRDLVLSFEDDEMVLRGAAGVHLDQWDFRY